MALVEKTVKARRLLWVAIVLASVSLAGAAAFFFLSVRGRGGGGDPEARKRTMVALARQSPLAAPRPFNRKEFEADPKPYLQTVEPGRCFQTAQPTGRDDVRLMMASSPLAKLSPGGSVVLKVKGVPKAPVTFTSFNGGSFKESNLGSVTVQSDETGIAVATFSAGPGIGGDLRIQAGSPLAVGSQVFLVRVSP